MKSCGHEIIQVLSRDSSHAGTLAQELKASHGDFSNAIKDESDIVIIAVSDAGLDQILPSLGGNKLLVHTAGSVSKNVLSRHSSNYGVLYPLQSLRKEMQYIPVIPFLVDGSNEGCTKYLEEFASTLSPLVSRTNDDERLKLHAAAVIVSNFTNHLYAIAEDFCSKEQVKFDMLKPLIVETANRVQYTSPSLVQTGPAVRKDIHTLDKHLRVLTNHPKLRTTYLRLTDSIMNP